MRLQYQLCNAAWIDCGKREQEFLEWCFENSGGDKAAVYAALAAGKTVRNDPDDWYSNCRDGDVFAAKLATTQSSSHKFTCRKCGEHRSTTIAGRCDDCG